MISTNSDISDNLYDELHKNYKINKYKNDIISYVKEVMFKTHKVRNLYEFINCLERLFISLLQSGSFPSKLSYVNKCVIKFLSELDEKNIIIPKLIMKMNEFYDKIIKESKIDKIIISKKICADIDYAEGSIKYLEFFHFIPSVRLNLMKEKLREIYKESVIIDNIIGLTVIKYNNILNVGNQWRINMNFYNALYNKYKINIEGFASPLNAAFLSKHIPFCSIFESDKCFGGIGNFFDLNELDGKTISINPPFIESLINRVYEKCNEWLNRYSIKLILILPDWKDAKYYNNFMNSKYLIEYKIYKKGKLPVEHVNGKEIKVKKNNYNMIFLVLSN